MRRGTKFADGRRIAVVGAGLIVLVVGAAVAPEYWLFLLTSAAVNAILLQSIGIVSGRCGMTALCQMSFAGFGAWTMAWLGAHDAPGTVVSWTILGGLAAVPAGLCVGLLSGWLRGASLAIATLGAATFFDATFAAVPFPGELTLQIVPLPDALRGDRAFFLFAAITCVSVGTLVHRLSTTHVGLSWVMLRHSERAAAAMGTNVVAAKLSAFAWSAFIAGVGGAVLTAQLGGATWVSFNLMASLTLFTAGIMMRAERPIRAVVGGVIAACLPPIVQVVGLPQDVVGLVFAVGAIHELGAHRSARQRETTPRAEPDAESPSRAPTPSVSSTVQTPSLREVQPIGRMPVLRVVGLAVSADSVPILQRASFTLHAGVVVGLVGPNGAGKSTLVDVLSGFVRPVEGRCMLEGRDISRWSARRRALAGVRRTWQQPRIAPALSAAEYVRLSVGRQLGLEDLRRCREWLTGMSCDGCVASLTVEQQRRLEVAAAVLARPRVLLLDEPFAGQNAEGTEVLAEMALWSARQGAAILLVEHNEHVVHRLCGSVVMVTPERGKASTLSQRRRASQVADLSSRIAGTA